VKPPRYPLAAALEQRKAAKETQARALAEAVLAVEREKATLRAREQARLRLEEDRAARASHLYDPETSGMLSLPKVEQRRADLRNLDARIERAGAEVEAQKQVLSRAETAAEAARTALVEADRELRAVEKHHEAWLAEWKKERARAEQREAEEVVLARYAVEGGERGTE
jgi:flagellar export protein FliJ